MTSSQNLTSCPRLPRKLSLSPTSSHPLSPGEIRSFFFAILQLLTFSCPNWVIMIILIEELVICRKLCILGCLWRRNLPSQVHVHVHVDWFWGKLAVPKVSKTIWTDPRIWIMFKRTEMIFSGEDIPNAINQERFWSYCSNLTLFVNVVKH